MKFAQLNEYGTPQHEVCSVEIEDPPSAPSANEVQLKMLACPINPAEMLLFAGQYASKPPLPYRPGIEGVGEIITIGKGVTGVAVGDRVISLGRQNWAQIINLPVESVIKVPATADVLQLGMLKVNPATAWMMLTKYVDLKPGSWVIQNAANSGVGHAVIQLARASGWRTVNVVRRETLIEPLLKAGADIVVVDSDDLGVRVAEATEKADIKLAIDAVAGSATRRLADCCGDEARIVNYGFLSGNPCEISADQTVFKSMTLCGFWLAKMMGAMKRADIESLYAKLSNDVVNGVIHAPVEATYTLDNFTTAIEHATREGRDGKIILTPNVT